MFIIRAVNVYPGQIDHVLSSIPGIGSEYQVHLRRAATKGLHEHQGGKGQGMLRRGRQRGAGRPSRSRSRTSPGELRLPASAATASFPGPKGRPRGYSTAEKTRLLLNAGGPPGAADGGRGPAEEQGEEADMVRFEYFKPVAVAEALEIMRRFDNDAAYIAGGTDVMVLLRQKKLSVRALISQGT